MATIVRLLDARSVSIECQRQSTSNGFVLRYALIGYKNAQRFLNQLELFMFPAHGNRCE